MSQIKDHIFGTVEAAKIIGCTPDYIRRLILDGKIEAQKIGQNWTMTDKDIAHFKMKEKKDAKNGKRKRTVGL